MPFASQPSKTENTRYFVNNPSGQPGGFLETSDPQVESLSYFEILAEDVREINNRYDMDMPAKEKALYDSLLHNNGFWRFLPVVFEERHSDAMDISKSMSDCYTAFGMGANPVSVNLQGVLYKTKDYDYRLDFMFVYDTFFRGQKQHRFRINLYMVIEDTWLLFKPGEFQYSVSSRTSPDFTPFSLSGIGYNYKVALENTSPLVMT